MARTTGPLMSLGASGSIAGTLTYATWRGRPYVRQLVTPANPNTPAQIGVRAMMKFLSQQWTTNVLPSASFWEALAKAGQYSEFNAYVKFNLKRWRDFNAPTQDPALNPGDILPTLANQTTTGGVRQVQLTQIVTTVAAGWGVIIFRELGSAPTPAFNNAIAIIPIEHLSDGDTITYLDTPLDPGTYHYKTVGFGILSGTMTAATADSNAVVT